MIRQFAGFLLLLFTFWAHAAPGVSIPEELKAWVPWVLEGKEQINCPFQYANGRQHLCAWSEVLTLDADGLGGSFAQNWTVYGESWLALPGSHKHWPQDVRIDGQLVVVTDRHGVPHIQLQKGAYQLTGRFAWNGLPSSIDLPKATGLLALFVDGKKIEFPHFEASGNLWLNKVVAQAATTIEDRLQLEVFRRVIDDVPLKVVTRLDLNVIGQTREIVLGPIFSDDYLPLSVAGPLPMRLEVDGRLRLQVRPGHWLVEIEARHKGLAGQLSLMPSDLPDSEVWVFDARSSLRLVEIEGVDSIDPRQTRLASDWQNLPTYRVSKQDTLNIVTKRRGDPDPGTNVLNLNRQLWLDFDGAGYTFQDHINGQMRSEWRLNMSSEMILGRVVVNGVDQLVSRLNDSPEQGIEVRQGDLLVQAEGRYEGDIARLPTVGWLDDFTRVQATLHLPPGWRLFSASGVDSVGGASWVEQWTLLDIFLVLIAALAVYRMLGGVWGGIALACFVMSWHEGGAPQYIWLLVIVAMALMHVAPPGRLYRSIRVARYLSLLGLLFIAIPYMVDTLRTAIYPQLERPSVMSYPLKSTVQHVPAQLEQADMMAEDDGIGVMSSSSVDLQSSLKRQQRQALPSYMYSDTIDPHAKVQTGPGLPDWHWSSVPIRWDGPVQQGQTLGLILISPAQTAIVKLSCVILVLLLGLRLAGVSLYGRRLVVDVAKVAVFSLFVSAPLLISQPVFAAGFPPPEILKELENRLLAPPECLPQCAQIPRMKLDVQADYMRLLLDVHANENVAIPVPSSIDGWFPTQVMLNGQPSQAMGGQGSALWVSVPKGRHQIQLGGAIRSVRVLQLPLPLQPREIEIVANGWQVKGVHQDGSIEQALQIERDFTEVAEEHSKVLEQTLLPPLVTVNRTLHLGLEWRVESEVLRLSPLGSAIALEIPLLVGESVTTDGVRVIDNSAIIQFSPQQQRVSWSSVLKVTPTILLNAADTLDWVEQWRLDVSSIWHAELSGIPQIHHQNQQGRWYPQWRPWPGEKLTIALSKPRGIGGKTKTIDHTQLTVKPGQRATDVSLVMRVRSSQAEQHIVQLPSDALLSTVKINGISQPIRQEEGGVVRLPIVPGEQHIVLDWQVGSGIEPLLSTPQINVGLENVNANVDIHLPESRWTLFTFGPQMGPAVLFWGVLMVVVMIAIGLGRTKQTPLKTHQWLLLGIGLSQTIIGVALLVVGWLFALDWRRRVGGGVKPQTFNAMQVGLGCLTLLALLGLVGAIGFGLLGHPDMQISGNGSNAYHLKWYADQSTEILPMATVFSVPMWLYRVLMLAWSLWLAFALLGWLKWAWQCFLTDGLWQARPTVPGEATERSSATMGAEDSWLNGASMHDKQQEQKHKEE